MLFVKRIVLKYVFPEFILSGINHLVHDLMIKPYKFFYFYKISTVGNSICTKRIILHYLISLEAVKNYTLYKIKSILCNKVLSSCYNKIEIMYIFFLVVACCVIPQCLCVLNPLFWMQHCTFLIGSTFD
jgi:hypothetical protein